MNGQSFAGDSIPNSRPGHRVYLVEFSSGTVKVGRSMSAPGRLKSHARSGRPFDVSLTRGWLSEELDLEGAALNEARLIELISNFAGRRISDEYFADVSFDLCVMTAERMQPMEVAA